jgi:hypothetical protein
MGISTDFVAFTKAPFVNYLYRSSLVVLLARGLCNWQVDVQYRFPLCDGGILNFNDEDYNLLLIVFQPIVSTHAHVLPDRDRLPMCRPRVE